MIIDCRYNLPFTPVRVFVGGVEVRLCWYTDDVLGLAKTLDVIGDGKAHHISHRFERGPEVYDRGDGVLSRDVSGAIEFRPL